jgi:hypothetical protein
MLIIGIHFFTWGSAHTVDTMHCSQCGAVTTFLLKKGMRFITLFFIIPLIPISGVQRMLQCPNCKTRYQVTSQQ